MSREALNAAQRSVVDAGGGVMLVLAGAGTGKTRTLTRRVARLINLGVSASRVCLLTFTNRAAESMVARMRSLGVQGVETLWAGTFHGLAARALRRWGHLQGVEPEFSVIDEQDAVELMARALKACAAPEALRADRVRGLYGVCLQKSLTLEQAVADRQPAWVGAEGLLRAVFGCYMAFKRAFGILDFEDLLVHWRAMLQRGAGTPAGGFEHVLVDEYQDTNRLQAEIVTLLSAASGNLTVVGDDCQSIYGFRGADHREILDFPRRFSRCRTIKLERNYRSTPQIVALANASIAHNVSRHDKTLRATRRVGAVPVVVACRDAEQEARFIAQRIAELRAGGVEASEIAVLYRAHRHGERVQGELFSRQIPFSLNSGLPFFERAHVKDALALLKGVMNPRDEVSVRRVLQRLPGVGRRGAERLSAVVATRSAWHEGLLAGVGQLRLSRAARESVERLAALVQRLPVSCGAALSESLRESFEGWLGRLCLAGREDEPRRLADLMALADYFKGSEGLSEALVDAALMAGERSRVLVSAAEASDCVTLSTIHKAKGLEWSAVFVLGLSQGMFPRDDSGSGASLEEERRLFYVALTRAKDTLVLTRPRRGRHRGRMTGLGASVFLKEVGAALGAEDSGGAPLVARWVLEEGEEEASSQRL